MKNPTIISVSFVALSVLFALTPLPASGHAESKALYAYHTLAICLMDECKGIELLNFQYGSTATTGLHADKGYLATGHIPQGVLVSGMFPIGEFLYVKWKYIPTGQEYEETADLEGRLPPKMDRKVLHVSIEGTQMHIEVIEGKDKAALHDPKFPDCPVKMFSMFKCTMIYPQRWANFQTPDREPSP